MTPRERILAVFRFEEVRPVPYTIWYDQATMEKLNLRYGCLDWQSRIRNGILRMTVNWEPRFPVEGNRYRDIFGAVWQRADADLVVEPSLKEPVLKGFAIPSYVPFLRQASSSTEVHSTLPNLSLDDVRRCCELEKERKLTVVGYGFGLFESAWIARGYENFCSDCLLEPLFAERLLDLLLERQLELVEELVKLPCDGIIVSDDYGDQRGVSIGPALWRRFLKPRLAKLYARIHAAGMLTFHHSCGNVFDIVPDLIDIGLDVLQSVQPEAMPVYELKREYGNHIRLWGGVGTQQLLPFGSPEEIRAEVRSLKRELGRGGGYVISSAKPILKDVPVENAAAFIEEILSETP